MAKTKTMTIFVTGVAGFVGSNIYNRLMQEGYTVYGCDNLQFGDKKNISEYDTNIIYDSFENCLERGLIADCDILIHAATCNIIYALNEPVKTFETNAVNTIKLFDKFKGKIINLSTASIYGSADIFPTPETARAKPYNAYDNSKYIAELYLAQRGNYTTLRLSNVYGPAQRSSNPYCGVMGKFIDNAVSNVPMEIIGDGLQTRDFTYVGDVVNAVIMAIEQPAHNTEINIATGVETTVKDLATKIWGATNGIQRIKFIPQRGVIDKLSRRCLSIEKANYTLGWQPKVTLEAGIAATIEWVKSEQVKLPSKNIL